MEIAHRPLPRVDVLAVTGRIDVVDTAVLKEELDKLFDAGHYRILLDLAGLRYINSAGLRVLVSARKRAQEHKPRSSEPGDVRLVNLPDNIKQVFDLVGFTGLFDIYDDMVDAVASF
ncbi:MAG: STAS domain-containing protein [Herpetosiphonaceae bacterium]|nr:STAS domain-containing protein [Herpetosiphonaceae bacterium]